jgi:hypothetical protein
MPFNKQAGLQIAVCSKMIRTYIKYAYVHF